MPRTGDREGGSGDECGVVVVDCCGCCGGGGLSEEGVAARGLIWYRVTSLGFAVCAPGPGADVKLG